VKSSIDIIIEGRIISVNEVFIIIVFVSDDDMMKVIWYYY